MASKSIFAVSEPQPHRDSISGFRHFVQFYDDEASLMERISRYLGTGLDSGESVLVIATETHHRNFDGRLRELGLDVAGYRSKGRYIAADAEQTLSGFMAGRRPDEAQFKRVIEALLEPALAAGKRPRLRAFGEMAACLWQREQPGAAIHLEELSNSLFGRWGSSGELALCCAYPLSCFRDPGQTDGFLKICAEHSRVFPAGAYGEGESRDALLRAMAQLEQSSFSFQKLAGRFLQEQEEERCRLGRVLHDGVAQKLALLAIRLDRLRESAGSQPPALDGELEAIREQVSEINDDIHHLSHGLHSAVLEQLGLPAGLRSLIAEFSEQHGILVYLESAPLPERLPAELALCLYRAVQESLRNVAEHSGAASARVILACVGSEIRLTVEDTGCGFDPSRMGAGLGMISMRERLRNVRGTLQIHSSPLHGTRVEVRVPCNVLQTA